MMIKMQITFENNATEAWTIKNNADHLGLAAFLLRDLKASFHFFSFDSNAHTVQVPRWPFEFAPGIKTKF